MRTVMSGLVFVFVMLLSMPVWAAGSGAYRIEVPDAGAMGKGGAFAGEANTPAAVFYNPAGMTQIEKDSFSLGVSVIQPKISYSPETGDEIQLKANTFYVPNFYYVTDLGLERFAFGVGATSAWGLATEWAPDVAVVRYNATRTEMISKDYMLTTAYKVTDQFSLGLGLDIDDSQVDKQKKIIQIGEGDANFRLKGDNTALGYRVAAHYKFNDKHQFGFLYRSPIEHKYHGKVYLDDLGTVPQAALLGFSYQQVFGGPSFQTEVVAKSTLPQSAVFGYSFKPNKKWTFNADVEWMDWGTIKKEEVGYPYAAPNAIADAILNTGNPTNRDWRDAFSFGLGLQYSISERLRVRGGYYFHQTPVSPATQDAAMPDADSHSLTTGLGYDVTKDFTIDFAWSVMLYKDRKIENEVNDTYGGIDGEYSEWVNLLLLTATYSF